MHYSPPRVWYSLHKRKQRLVSAPTVADPILPPHNSVAPAAPTGTATVGSVLTYASYGTWTNSPTSYDLQWYSNGVAVPYQVATTYTVRPDDVGYTITYLVTAHNSGGALTKMSAASGTIT